MPKVKIVNAGSPDAVKKFKELMAVFKTQNPVKYEKATTEKVFDSKTKTEYEWKILQLGGTLKDAELE